MKREPPRALPAQQRDVRSSRLDRVRRRASLDRLGDLGDLGNLGDSNRAPRSCPDRGCWLLLVIAMASVWLGCPGAGSRRSVSTVPGESVGIYRARIEGQSFKDRRFRLMLFAAQPDRIHGEVISPLGTTVLIFDGGGGRLAVSFVRERTGFVGSSDPAAVEKVMGVRLSLEDIVSGLLREGFVRDGFEVEREARSDGALPQRLTIRGPDRTLTLELKRMRPLPREAARLGAGAVPEGFSVRQLSELDEGWVVPLTEASEIDDEAGAP